LQGIVGVEACKVAICEVFIIVTVQDGAVRCATLALTGIGIGYKRFNRVQFSVSKRRLILLYKGEPMFTKASSRVTSRYTDFICSRPLP
jgi:hypothetical protein